MREMTSGHLSDSAALLAKGSYHHGSLREALIAAADSLLTENGLEGFSLREAARRAGVSPAAPAHHFGSATGLLTEVAIRGFVDLKNCLRSAREDPGLDPSARLQAQGMAYVRFALAYPGRFQLMFRQKRLIPRHDLLLAASRAAHAELELAMREYLGNAADGPPDRATLIGMTGAWSVAHGFAQLALDGKFDRASGEGGLEAFVADVLPQMLEEMWPPRTPKEPRA